MCECCEFQLWYVHLNIYVFITLIRRFAESFPPITWYTCTPLCFNVQVWNVIYILKYLYSISLSHHDQFFLWHNSKNRNRYTTDMHGTHLSPCARYTVHLVNLHITESFIQKGLQLKEGLHFMSATGEFNLLDLCC